MHSMSEAIEDELGGKRVIDEEKEKMSVEEDKYGGVILTVHKSMDSSSFASKLQDSVSHWQEQRKKGIWINLPILHSNLVHSAVQVYTFFTLLQHSLQLTCLLTKRSLKFQVDELRFI